MLKLMDSLVKPIATYGCPVWLPSTNMIKAIISTTTEGKPMRIAKSASKDVIEVTHLKILKWVLGVHKKTSNNACYGDTGRTPWAISTLRQCTDYFHRASSAVTGNVNTMLHHTFSAQKHLNLSWYNTWSVLIDHCSKAKPSMSPASAVNEHIKDIFTTQWRAELLSQTKMCFYSSTKQTFGEEPYLKLPNRAHRAQIAKLRSSSHDLKIEKGRYTAKQYNKHMKACRFCCTDDPDIISNFEMLPFFEDPVIESEEHVLTECPGYHHLRLRLSDNLKSLIMLKEYGAIMTSRHLPEFGRYLFNCFLHRNPRKNPPT